jgi:putative ATP-binding cassette transporter
MSSVHAAMHKPVLRRFIRLSRGYLDGDQRWRARFQTLAMLLLGAAQVALAIRLNLWSADLFDALERHASDRFLYQVGIFAALILGIMIVNMLHLQVKRDLQLGWRAWLTGHVLQDWMADARHYQISLLPGDHDNPDARIADDIRVATEAAIDLVHSAFYCLLLLVSFFSILWALSGVVMLDLAGVMLPIHGHMVWLAFLYAGAGSVLAFLVGGQLMSVANSRQTTEADFRFALAGARENAEAIALVQREADERQRLKRLFDLLQTVWNEQTVGLRSLMLFSSAYSVLATMFPLLVASPRYLAGSITLGALMQTGQAFQQMTAALSWPVDNFARLAEWHASVERILALHDAVDDLQQQIARQGEAGIRVSATAGPALTIRDLAIASPAHGVLASGISAEIQPGERVLITGDSEVGMMLFKAVTGIWLWGSGAVELPDNASIVFMPARPYLPHDRLRTILAYPADAAALPDETCHAVLRKVGLPQLEGQLDAVEAWDHLLSPADQQRLACANLLLRRPQWIFLAHATEALEAPEELALLHMLFVELAGATILTLSHRAGLDALHSRKLYLERKGDRIISVHDEGLPLVSAPAAASRFGRVRRLLASIREGLS